MRIALAGAGAFGEKHLDGLKLIDGVEIVIDHQPNRRTGSSRRREIRREAFARPNLKMPSPRDDVDAVILCTPTQMHAAQAIMPA